MMARHNLKIWPEYFLSILDGSKRFEIRRNDREFNVGDILVLREFHPNMEIYTGRKLAVKVTYVVKGCSFGIPPHLSVMSISEPLQLNDFDHSAEEALRELVDAIEKVLVVGDAGRDHRRYQSAIKRAKEVLNDKES